MEEAITFWLDNKISSGFKVAEIGGEMLVSYRDKYYLIEGGAAKMKGVRPLHYSKTSLPTVWKKAINGILPLLTTAVAQLEEENLPAAATTTKKERSKMQKTSISATDRSDFQMQGEKPQQTALKTSAHSKAFTDVKPIRSPQTAVVTNCPYCNHKHDLPFEKGKNGKPFFVACARCSIEFAVRFVPVIMYQSQVAAFR